MRKKKGSYQWQPNSGMYHSSQWPALQVNPTDSPLKKLSPSSTTVAPLHVSPVSYLTGICVHWLLPLEIFSASCLDSHWRLEVHRQPAQAFAVAQLEESRLGSWSWPLSPCMFLGLAFPAIHFMMPSWCPLLVSMVLEGGEFSPPPGGRMFSHSRAGW